MNVLIVDDHKEFTFILERYLNIMKIEVCGIAGDGEEALSMIGAMQPDIVILDIMLPKLDGAEVLRRSLSLPHSKKSRFIVLTAIDSESLGQKMLNLGADLYIVKPFDLRNTKTAAGNP